MVSIYIGGGTPSTLPVGAIRNIMGAINKAFIVSGDAEVTIEINPNTLTREKAIEYITRLGLDGVSDASLASLSGGLRQRVYVCAALTQESDYLLMDEPTAYLDAPHRVGLMRLLASVAREGRGVLAVLHDVDLAMRYADTVAVMKNGELVCIGTPAEVLGCGALDRAFGMPVRLSAENGRYYFDEEA